MRHPNKSIYKAYNTWSLKKTTITITNIFFQTNAVLLTLVIHEILKMQSNKAPNAEKLRQAAKACVVLSPLLGMTWAFGILSVTNAGIVFQYIFIVLNSLQVTYELLLLVAIVAKHALQVLLRLGHLTTCYLSRLASSTRAFPQMEPVSFFFSELRELRMTKLFLFTEESIPFEN